uniref:SKP1 component POZ domain-containing protein n=1 Tax=Panagrolaimus sp. JU765 TaxID=591449 RepID=A0AC34R460_9BILA
MMEVEFTKPEGSTRVFTIVCSDGVEIKTSEKVICQSELFSEIIKFTDPEKPIPVQIGHRPMKAIVEYLELYKDDPPYIPPTGYNCEMSTRDTEFFDKIDNADLIEYLNAGNYLNVQRLLKIRGWLEGKNEAEYRHILQLPDDYTEAEKDANYQEYSFFDPDIAIAANENENPPANQLGPSGAGGDSN